MYKNPVPVSVCLVPIDGKLLGVKRGIEPRKGFVALPGGYVNSDETWQQACVRELFEETGVKYLPEDIKLISVESALDSNRLLIFGSTPELSKNKIDWNFKNDETSELSLISADDELAFPIHTLVANNFLKNI